MFFTLISALRVALMWVWMAPTKSFSCSTQVEEISVICSEPELWSMRCASYLGKRSLFLPSSPFPSPLPLERSPRMNHASSPSLHAVASATRLLPSLCLVPTHVAGDLGTMVGTRAVV